MFATFDYTLYNSKKIVKIKLNNKIQNDQDFSNFLDSWLNLYENKQQFTFIFDTSNVGYIPIKYSIQMSLFIKNLKKQKTQYLQRSIIYVNNNIVKRMLDFIFILQPPVAPVYIVSNNSYIDLILNKNTNEIDHKIIKILPSKSFLNIL
tara:strand:- start:5462 stop:5908 length:447 start_codon:yes stop_codon:yes gene_type:complete